MKVQPIPHVILQTTRLEFIQILHHYSVSWKITSLYFFSLNLIYFVVWKMTWGILQIFTRTFKSVNIGTLMGSFCPKLKMQYLKIYRGYMCTGTEDWWKVWREIDMSFQNWYEEFDEFWLEHSKVSKICTLTGSFWPKYIIFELRKVQTSYLSWCWRVMQNLKKNWLAVWKMTWRIWQIFTHSKVSKLGLWWDLFV